MMSSNSNLDGVKQGLENVNNTIENAVSKVPVLSQLVDDNVSDTHKILIVAAIVIAFIFITRMIKN
jgi:hypothetical protein